jgi:hypothetical protein
MNKTNKESKSTKSSSKTINKENIGKRNNSKTK